MAFDKAAFFFGLTLRKVDFNLQTFEVDAEDMRRLINKNTIAVSLLFAHTLTFLKLVGSFPNYPHGI